MSLAGSAAPTQGIGRAEKAGYIAESAFETIAGLSGIERFDFISMPVKLEQERAERTDRRAYPGLEETICRKRGATWSIESYLLPSGTAGTAPDIGSVLQDSGFTETVTPATSVAYTLRDGVTSFALLKDTENVSQLVHGCLGEEVKISWNGADDAKISISGKGSNALRAGTTTLAAILNATDTTVTVTEAEYFEVGSYIQFVGDTNSGNGYKVTARNTVANTLTIDPQAAVGAANGSAVSPIIPAGATVGSPVCGNTGSVVIDGVTHVTTAGEITLTNTIWTDDDNYGSASYTGNYRLQDRRVTFSLTLYATNANNIEFLRSLNHTGSSSADIAVVIGSTAGSILTIDMDYAQFDISELDVGGDEAAMFTLTGKALFSSGNDELVLTFT